MTFGNHTAEVNGLVGVGRSGIQAPRSDKDFDRNGFDTGMKFVDSITKPSASGNDDFITPLTKSLASLDITRTVDKPSAHLGTATAR